MSTESTIVTKTETEATSKLIEQAVASISLNTDQSNSDITVSKKKKKKNKKKTKSDSHSCEASMQIQVVDIKQSEVVQMSQELVVVDVKENAVVQVSQELVVAPEAQSNQQVVVGDGQPADNFDNLQKAVQILAKAKTLDEGKQFDAALKMYRQGVDMLIEELIGRQGTDQSRMYLRNKCNDFMNRIDQLKMLIKLENASKENANKENTAIDA